MQWGGHREEFLKRWGQMVGRTLPAIEERPELFEDLVGVWRAFWVLSPSRQTGWGVGYIPLSEIKAYLDLFPVGDAEEFVVLIREMDAVFVQHHATKDKRDGKCQTSNHPRRRKGKA